MTGDSLELAKQPSYRAFAKDQQNDRVDAECWENKLPLKNNQKSESETGQNTAISTQTAISFMRMLSTILPGVLNMGCCPWDVSTCICLQSLLFDNYENESFLTCPV